MSCESCTDLRVNSAEFIQNGVNENVCTSLKNDTGFSPDNAHNNCTDIQLATDCLIGDMAEEVECYEVCDWQEATSKLISNIFAVLTAINCSMCGLWTNVHALWNKIQEILNDITALGTRITNLENSTRNSVTNINNQITDINTTMSTVPKQVTAVAAVSNTYTLRPGYDENHNYITIPVGRNDGLRPIGIVGWNLNNAGSSTGVSNVYPFQVALQGNNAVVQLRNTTNENKTVTVEVKVLYIK